MSITLEPSKIEVSSDTVYTIRWADHQIKLNTEQAEELFSKLARILGKNIIQTQPPMKKILENAKTLGYVEYEDTLIPVGYKPLFKATSKPRNGKPVHYYHYFKNTRGDYGFLVKNGTTKPFSKLGRISNPNSAIGKAFKVLPKSGKFAKSFLVNYKIISNNQRIKAIIDILIFEGYLKEVKKPDSKIVSYLVTNKGLEFVDNIEPIKVQYSPTRNKIMGM